MALRHTSAYMVRLQLVKRFLVREAEQHVEVSFIAFTRQGGQTSLLGKVGDIGGNHGVIIIVIRAFHTLPRYQGFSAPALALPRPFFSSWRKPV